MNTSSLIVIICVVIPAVLAISVCLVVYYSRRSKTRKFRQQENLSYEYRPQDAHPRPYSYQQQHRLREPSAVFEQQPPLYNRPIRLQQLPLFSPVYTTPSRPNVQQTQISLTPSIHTGSPPSYEEIFLTPHRLTD